MNIDLREWAWNELGLHLAVENDARLACIGEWQYGAGKGCDNLVGPLGSDLQIVLAQALRPEVRGETTLKGMISRSC